MINNFRLSHIVSFVLGFGLASVLFYTPIRKPIITNNVIDSVAINDSLRIIDSLDSIAIIDSIKVADSLSNILNAENLLSELIKQDVKFPHIVLAQAKLETGNFTSRLCKTHNNLFGLKHRKGYYSFKTWQESVTGYKNWVQYKYKSGDYYEFLDRIGYAEDPSYIQKLKVI